MSLFSYTAKNSEGQTIKGIVDPINVDTASDELRDRQLIVLSIKEKSEYSIGDKLSNIFKSVGVKDVTFFARQLSVLIGASIPVVRALRILIKQTNNNAFKTIIADIASEVDGGSKLSQALKRYPKVFDQFFIHMIRAGETTGRLDKVLEYLAEQKEKDYNLRSRIKGAMIYPAFILGTMIIIAIVMMVYVVPKLADVITQGGGEIPITTKILLGTSSFLVNFWWLLLIFVVICTVGFMIYIKTSQGRYYYDLLKIRLPILGNLYRRVLLTRFSMSLSNLLASGVPVTKSLQIVADIVDNNVYYELIQKTIIEVESGNSIASVFMHDKHVPPIVSQMMSIGEETGKIDSILVKLADFYSKEVENAINSLTSVIEPLVIIFLGLGAAIIVTGILTPMYNATSSFA